jgi:hypothetical protein
MIKSFKFGFNAQQKPLDVHQVVVCFNPLFLCVLPGVVLPQFIHQRIVEVFPGVGGCE